MVRIDWQNDVLDVTRLVLAQTTPPQLQESFRSLADEYGLGLAEDKTTPRSGDLWVGTAPERGWGDESRRIGWAQGIEAYLVLGLLRRAGSPIQDSAILVDHYN